MSVVASVKFIGTATTVLRLGEFTVLTDPNFLHQGQLAYLGKGLFTRRLTEPAMQPSELPPLDGVLLSHLHGDHFDRIARRELPTDIPLLTTPHAARRLRHRFTEAVPMPTWSTRTLQRGADRLTVTAVPGRHAFGLMGKLLPPVMGSVLELHTPTRPNPLRIYLTGDTLMYDELREIGRRFPSLDLALLHLGGTKVLGAMVTMDGAQGVDLLELLRPREAVPVHYDDYRVFRSPLSDFTAEVRRRNPDTVVRYLKRGESHSIPSVAVAEGP
ncbi:MAG: MBL fold metallo-hydrolase [Pseudonocardiaceae bacterium]